jgi:predicted transcriptional regulator of viral defense system
MSNKSIILLNDAYKNAGKISRTRAIELIGHCYYHNGPKYVSEILTRLVNSGKLTRVGRGNYEIANKKAIKAVVAPELGSNQIKLF